MTTDCLWKIQKEDKYYLSFNVPIEPSVETKAKEHIYRVVIPDKDKDIIEVLSL